MSSSDRLDLDPVSPIVSPLPIAKSTPNFMLVPKEKTEFESTEEWPGNPYDSDGQPMFTWSMFEYTPFIGPIPIFI